MLKQKFGVRRLIAIITLCTLRNELTIKIVKKKRDALYEKSNFMLKFMLQIFKIR